jgi:phospholipid-binding lipoprotein MlaA
VLAAGSVICPRFGCGDGNMGLQPRGRVISCAAVRLAIVAPGWSGNEVWQEAGLSRSSRAVAGTATGRPWLAWLRGAVIALGLLAAPALAQEQQDDPLEPLNRGIFQFNRVVDGLLLEPAARMYRMATPQFFRTGVRNFLGNLSTPVVLANDLLQGDFQRAELTLGRFMMNTILGLGGLIDVGGKLGMPERHYEDFGQTLAVYGVGFGPYLMLPLLGPSSGRDAVGRVVDLAFDPLTVVGAADIDVVIDPTTISLARTGAEALSQREQSLEQVDELRRSSIDLYAAVRTLYFQYRENQIRNGVPAEIDDIYDENLYEDPDSLSDGSRKAPLEDSEEVYEDPETSDAE